MNRRKRLLSWMALLFCLGIIVVITLYSAWERSKPEWMVIEKIHEPERVLVYEDRSMYFPYPPMWIGQDGIIEIHDGEDWILVLESRLDRKRVYLEKKEDWQKIKVNSLFEEKELMFYWEDPTLKRVFYPHKK